MLWRRGRQHGAKADPLLLERILRDLLGNAIRDTEDCSVMVSRRRRSHPDGERLMRQVWDSHFGVSPESLPRTWDGFFQVSGRQAGAAAAPLQGAGAGAAHRAALAPMVRSRLTVRSRDGMARCSRSNCYQAGRPGSPSGRLPPCGYRPG